MSPSEVESLISDQLLPAWHDRLDTLDEIDGWIKPGIKRDKFPIPRRANDEHKALQALSEAPWGGIVVSTVSQTLDLESIYTETADDPAVAALWKPWKRSGMDAMQVPLHRGSIAFGEAYNRVTLDEHGNAVINPRSARDAFAVYRDSRDLFETPMYVLEKDGQWNVNNPIDFGHLILWDDADDDGVMYRYRVGVESGDVKYIDHETHQYGAVPFIRYAPQLDLEGLSLGEIRPLAPLLGRIEKTAYDRLVIQHKESWKVRTATGLDGDKFTEEDKVKLAVGDIMTGEEGVQFGTLDETSVEPIVKAHEADIDVLSAVSQTPITALGKFINVSADAIAEARAALYAKRDEYRKMLGISHLNTLRFAAHIEDRAGDAANFDVYCGWADTEVRTMSAAADALGKVATMLEVPVQELWPMLPFVNYTMAEKWKSAAKSQANTEKAVSSIADALRLVPEPQVADDGPAAS